MQEVDRRIEALKILEKVIITNIYKINYIYKQIYI